MVVKLAQQQIQSVKTFTSVKQNVYNHIRSLITSVLHPWAFKRFFLLPCDLILYRWTTSYWTVSFDVAMETPPLPPCQWAADGSINEGSPWKAHAPTYSLCSDTDNDAAVSAFGLETLCIFSTLFKFRARHMVSHQFQYVSAESLNWGQAHIMCTHKRRKQESAFLKWERKIIRPSFKSIAVLLSSILSCICEETTGRL